MSTYILTYQGYGEEPEALASRLRRAQGVRVVDRFGQHMVVEGPKDLVSTLTSNLMGWSSAPERRIRRPRAVMS
jgi:hypothetical protein